MAYNTIKIKKYVDIVEEYQAASTVTPGALVELTSAGKVQNHSSAGQNALPMFALEDELQGNGINDNYSADDQVQVWVAVRGEQVNAILADGEDVSVGDFLESDGAGNLQKYTADSAGVVEYPNSIVAVALEDVVTASSSGLESSGELDNFATLGYKKRIKVRII